MNTAEAKPNYREVKYGEVIEITEEQRAKLKPLQDTRRAIMDKINDAMKQMNAEFEKAHVALWNEIYSTFNLDPNGNYNLKRDCTKIAIGNAPEE